MTVNQSKIDGDNYYRAGNYAAAVNCYNQVIQQGPLDLHVCYSNRSACYIQLGDYYKALDDANSCIRLKPNWAKGHIRKGACLVKIGRISEALQSYNKAVELDPSNNEAANEIRKLRGEPSSSSSSSGNSTRSTDTHYSQSQTANSPDLLTTIKEFLSKIYFQFLSWWMSLDGSTKNYIQLGIGAMVVYYFFFYRSSSSAYYGNSYYDSGYGGYYGYSTGLSWSAWAVIMFAGYKVPPMFPQIFGDYARPYFGMNWTTFMWLLNMLTNNRRYGGYGGGMFGAPRGYRRYY